MKSPDEIKKKKVVIIGAGLAGLSAGSFLARNSFDVEIVEMHNLPGGQCTSWKNGSFTFDSCVHWLIGSKPGGYMNRIWNELDALKHTEIVNHERYMICRYPDGSVLTFYSDPDQLEKELLRFSSEDKKEIKNFVGAVRKASELKMPEPDSASDNKTLTGLFELIRFMLQFTGLLKWMKISSREYGDKFKNKKLSIAIRNLFSPEFAMLFNLFTFAWLSQKNAGYPIGGSLKFARAIAENCEKHGAAIRYKSRVKKILTENTSENSSHASGDDGKNNCRVAGVELENGEILKADYVVSAADGKTTVEILLEGRFHHPRLKKAWDTLPLFEPLFYISLGMKGPFEDPNSVSGSVIILNDSLDTGNKKIDSILLHSLSFDPTLAPPGKSVVEIMCTADYDYWSGLKASSKEKYKLEKKRVADKILNVIDRDYIPGFKSRIEKIDIATPMTWVRYTGVHRGAFEGWQMSKDILKVGMNLPKQLKGLNNFYLCGQWVEPGGGLPVAAYSGKNVARRITKAEERTFTV